MRGNIQEVESHKVAVGAKTEKMKKKHQKCLSQHTVAAYAKFNLTVLI